MRRAGSLLALVAVALAGCGADGATGRAEPGTGSAAVTSAGTQRFPDVLEAEVSPSGSATFDVRVTMSSPYDTPRRYADGWRVLAPDGTVLGEHTLAHDHAGEQPFSRTQSGLEIPDDVDRVTVQGRDQQFGYGGATVTADVPR